MKARRSGRVGGIQGQIGAAGLEDGQQGDEQVGGALQAEADEVLGSHAEGAAGDGPAGWRGG